MKIGEFIKQKRLESGMTQSDLYNQLPTRRKRDKSKYPGRARISKLESGKQDITFTQLQAIADLFKQRTSEFLEEFESQQ